MSESLNVKSGAAVAGAATGSAHLRYRCRWCGQEFEGWHGNMKMLKTYFIRLLSEERITDAGSFVLTRIEMHYHHADGTLGFGDLIGVCHDAPNGGGTDARSGAMNLEPSKAVREQRLARPLAWSELTTSKWKLTWKFGWRSWRWKLSRHYYGWTAELPWFAVMFTRFAKRPSGEAQRRAGTDL